MTERETAARAQEIRFTAILDRRQTTNLLRASPRANRAAWRIWAVLTLSTGFFFAAATLIGFASDLELWAVLSATVLTTLAIMFLLLLVANPWWLPRLAPHRVMVGLPTHWRLTRAGAEMTGERGAMSIAWNAVETVLEKDGLLVLVTKPPRRLIGFPLNQLEAGDIATIQHWVDASGPAQPHAISDQARPVGTGIVVTAAPLTRSQALTVTRANNHGLPRRIGFIALLCVLFVAVGIAKDRPLIEALRPLAPLVLLLVAVALVIRSAVRRLVRVQPFAGTWAFDPSGVTSPNPLGAVFVTPWDQVKLVMVRRDVLLLRLGYAATFLGLPTTQLSSNDLEQILSWATAAQVRTR